MEETPLQLLSACTLPLVWCPSKCSYGATLFCDHTAHELSSSYWILCVSLYCLAIGSTYNTHPITHTDTKGTQHTSDWSSL